MKAFTNPVLFNTSHAMHTSPKMEVCTIAQITRRVKGLLEERIGSVRVRNGGPRPEFALVRNGYTKGEPAVWTAGEAPHTRG